MEGRAGGRTSEQTVVFAAVCAIVLYLVAGPLILLLYGSVSSSPPGEFGRLTADNFLRMMRDPRLGVALRNTLTYSALASTLAVALGGLLAWIVQRTNAPFRRVMFIGVLAPAFVPSVLMATSWLMLLSPRTGALNAFFANVLGFGRPLIDVFSLGGMVWVGTVAELPLAFLWLSPALYAMDPALEEAAAVSGYNLGEATLRIVLPLIAPALLGTWLIVFILHSEELAVPLFIGIPARVPMLSTQIWLATRRVPPDMNLASAYGVSLMAITLAGLFLYRRVTAIEGKYVTITGKAYRPRIHDLRGWRYPIGALGLLMVMMTTVLPGLIFAWNSLMPFAQIPSREALAHLTLDNYQLLLDGTTPWTGVRNSLMLGVLSGLGTMLITLVAAWIVLRSRVRARQVVDFLATTPVAVPGIVMAVSLVWFYLTVPVPVYGTVWILLLAYLARFLPYGMRLSYSSFGQIHPELEECAYVHGAGWTRTMRDVVVPLLMPGMVAGVIYVMLRAFKELPASLMLLSFGNETFSAAAFDLWDNGEVGQLAAYGVIATALLGVIVGIVYRLGQRYGLRLE